MNWSMAIFTFINAWWIMLFFVLPFSIQHDEGSYGGVKITGWRKKLAINTLLSMLVTAGLALIINGGFFTLRSLQP